MRSLPRLPNDAHPTISRRLLRYRIRSCVSIEVEAYCAGYRSGGFDSRSLAEIVVKERVRIAHGASALR